MNETLFSTATNVSDVMHAACPLCLRETTTTLVAVEPATLYPERHPTLVTATVSVERCNLCRGVFVARTFPEEWLTDFYGGDPAGGIPLTRENFYWWDRETGSSCRQIMAAIGQPHGGRLLDAGCGKGVLSALAVDLGWDVTALDISSELTAFVERTFRISTITGTLADVIGPFDAIVLMDVLEHLYSPTDALDRCYALLRPGGRLAIKVPHGAMQWRKERLRYHLGCGTGFVATLGHLNQFDRVSLAAVLRRTGFSTVAIGPADSFLPHRQPMRVAMQIHNGATRVWHALTGNCASFNLLAIAER